jgi:hypothetical protein
MRRGGAGRPTPPPRRPNSRKPEETLQLAPRRRRNSTAASEDRVWGLALNTTPFISSDDASASRITNGIQELENYDGNVKYDTFGVYAR